MIHWQPAVATRCKPLRVWQRDRQPDPRQCRMLDVTESAFGSRLRELRQARGLTQQSLGDTLHYTKSWVSRLEGSRKKPTLEDVRRLDVALAADGGLISLAIREWPRLARVQAVPVAPVRAELPPGPSALVGRDGEVSRILDHLRPGPGRDGRAVRICLIHGLAGIGKTALATYTANLLSRHFPDGQLYLDLYGYTVDRANVSTSDALDSLLRRFKPAPPAPADSTDDLVVELRTLTSGRRFLVLVENASDAEQVELLLSALPGSAAIVTSRSRLTALDDASRIDLRELSEADGEELFRRGAQDAIHERGGTTDLEETSACIRRIVQMCYRFPFAIRIMASRFRDNKTLMLADVEQVLGDQDTRLSEMSDGERSMMGVLDASYALLNDTQRQALMALSVHPGVRIDRLSCGALLDDEPRRAEGVLDGLLRTYLVVEHSKGAYQLHDLIRDFMRHGPEGTGPSPQRRLELRERLFDYYLRSAVGADLQIEPDRYHVAVTLLPDPPFEREFRSTNEALLWLSSEQENLLEVCREMLRTGFSELCWRFCYYLRGYFYTTRLWKPWADVFRVGLEAARDCGNRRAEGIMLTNIGLALTEAEELTDAVPYYEQAIVAFEETGDEHGVATARGHLGWACHQLHQDQEAYALTSSVLDFYRTNGNPWTVATTAEALGHIELRRGETAQAAAHFTEALGIFEELGRPVDARMVREVLRTLDQEAM